MLPISSTLKRTNESVLKWLSMDEICMINQPSDEKRVEQFKKVETLKYKALSTANAHQFLQQMPNNYKKLNWKPLKIIEIEKWKKIFSKKSYQQQWKVNEIIIYLEKDKGSTRGQNMQPDIVQAQVPKQ